jgi:hypothetical protein
MRIKPGVSFEARPKIGTRIKIKLAQQLEEWPWAKRVKARG